MTVTLEDIKALRARTHAPVGDCKAALEAVGGDLEKAVDELRKKGLSLMVKRGDKEAAQGLVGAYASGNTGVIVEVSAETDFVARNEMFQEFVDSVTQLAYEKGAASVQDLEAATYKGGTVKDALAELVATIRENITFGRVQRLEVSSGCVGAYTHDKASRYGGRIGDLVALESQSSSDALADVAKKLCMHVAANKPEFCFEQDIDKDSLKRERALAEEKARASGKPEHILEKIIDGRMKAYAETVVFIKQPYLFDSGKTVEEMVSSLKEETGAPVELKGFSSFSIKGS